MHTLATNFKMLTIYNDERAASMIRAVIQDIEVRETIESFSCAEFNTEHIVTAIREVHQKVVPEEIIRLYVHMVWDLSLLTSWEQDMLFEMHGNGENYRVLHNMGHQVAMFYAGAQVNVDEEEALRYMRAASAVKFKEAVVSMDAKEGAVSASKWADIYLKATNELGPMAMINKLIDKVQKLKARGMNLDSMDLPQLQSHSQLSHGLAVLQDIAEAKKRDDHETDK